MKPSWVERVQVSVDVAQKGNGWVDSRGRYSKGYWTHPTSTISDASGDVLMNAIQQMVSEDSTIRTDGWPGYNGLSNLGYVHLPMNNHNVKEDDVIEEAHLVASLLSAG